jgi:adenosylcobyric acid synthase
MLGNKIIDNQGFDGKPTSIEGLNLLNVYTTMKKEKNLGKKVFQSSINNEKISGYEIHLGQTEGLDSKRPFAKNMNSSDGAISENGRIMGTYIHGLFFMDQFRNTFFSKLSEREIRYNLSYSQNVENVLDEFVALMEKNLDVEKILSTARKIGS